MGASCFCLNCQLGVKFPGGAREKEKRSSFLPLLDPLPSVCLSRNWHLS